MRRLPRLIPIIFVVSLKEGHVQDDRVLHGCPAVSHGDQRQGVQIDDTRQFELGCKSWHFGEDRDPVRDRVMNVWPSTVSRSEHDEMTS